MSSPVMVTWKMSKEAADLLYETLSLDAESAAFDPKLREDISKALSEVVETVLL